MSRRTVELGIGVRAALASPTTRLRTALTILGVAAGVCVLLIAASVPHAVGAREGREAAIAPSFPKRSHLRLLEATTDFGGVQISESIVQKVGDGVPARELPPGVARLPKPGEMVISPVVAEMLRGPRGAELRRRLHARAIGRIGDAGLVEPDEALVYRGTSLLDRYNASFATWQGGAPSSGEGLRLITLLTIVLVVALLLPVALLVATAARFGGEERERRLAAMRIVGADLGGVARIAAGEALLGAVGGLILGGIGFVALRPSVAGSGVAGAAVQTADLRPSVALAILIAVLVPAAAVGAMLAGVRAVAIEPLGLTRKARPRPRRLLWRLVVPALGFALLVPLDTSDSQLRSFGSQVEAAAAVILVLLGAAALLPWVVEAIARRAPDGPLSWLLAIRSLRLEGGTATRVVGSIALALAGAVALTIIFETARSDVAVHLSPTEARTVSVELHAPSYRAASGDIRRLRRVPGVERLTAKRRRSPELESRVSARVVLGKRLVVPAEGKGGPVLQVSPGSAAALSRVEDWAARNDPIARVTTASTSTRRSRAVDQLERALQAGGLVVLAMIGASLLIASAESLRERRAGLAALAAVGTDKGTVAYSLLWQGSIPVLAGLALGIGLGVGLGAMLNVAVHLDPVYDWGSIALIAVAGLAVAFAVTGLTLLGLSRAMRPPKLRVG